MGSRPPTRGCLRRSRAHARIAAAFDGWVRLAAASTIASAYRGWANKTRPWSSSVIRLRRSSPISVSRVANRSKTGRERGSPTARCSSASRSGLSSFATRAARSSVRRSVTAGVPRQLQSPSPCCREPLEKAPRTSSRHARLLRGDRGRRARTAPRRHARGQCRRMIRRRGGGTALLRGWYRDEGAPTARRGARAYVADSRQSRSNAARIDSVRACS
jgi:hypothetical protein